MTDLTVIERCRACRGTSLEQVLSLGQTPLANSLLPAEGGTSALYPLNLMRCTSCSLAQLAEIVSPEALFSDYVYFSSNSETTLQHAKRLADELVTRERLGPTHLVVELASNDGYLLQYFKQHGVPVLGIEPAANIARVAETEKGIPTMPVFFDVTVARDLASKGQQADVILGNNVLAHVPDLNGFVQGIATLLKASGIAAFEFPYVHDMLEQVEFDTIYHEHQCYFSLTALQQLLARHGLEVVDVERIAIHGGSLRMTAAQHGQRTASPHVADLLESEMAWGVNSAAAYTQFADAVARLKRQLLEILSHHKRGGERIAAYGAAAKGVTLTSYCGIGSAYLDYVVDRSPYKQGLRFPVDGLPIFAPNRLCEDRPDYALLLTWNFADEIIRQQSAYRASGGRFIVPVPEPRIVS